MLFQTTLRNSQENATSKKSNKTRFFRLLAGFGLIVLGTACGPSTELAANADDSPATVVTIKEATRPSGNYNAASDVRRSSPALADATLSDRGTRYARTRDPDMPTLPASAAPNRPDDPRSESEKIQERLTYRYSNPVVERFPFSVSTDRALALYDESARLIDARHLQPTSYAERAYQGVKNLLHAAGNRAFLEANGLSPSRSQVDAFRSSLTQLAASTPVRNASEARSLMLRTMDLAGRQMGIRPATVAMEFVYGAAETLDKYSTFLPQESGREPSASLEDHVVGIGVEIKPHESGVLVVKPLRGGPAEEAGLKPGDIIVSVNGRSLAGQSLDFAVDLIGGPEGSNLLLIVERDGRRLSPVSLVRRRVEIHSVSDARMLDEAAGVAYIKLDTFAEKSSEEMDVALWDLYRKGMKSLVFDLRGNPGGLLTTAIELSDKFLPSGTIVSTRGRNSVDDSSERATFERTWKIPLVVLVDGNSASASEIFAAAIQENERGLIVGRHSYGKGTVQTHFPLQSVAGNLKLTTAKFYSPRGRQMAGAGVEPDIRVDKADGDEGFVQLSDDKDIQTAVTTARGSKVRELAEGLSRTNSRGLLETQPGN